MEWDFVKMVDGYLYIFYLGRASCMWKVVVSWSGILSHAGWHVRIFAPEPTSHL